MPLEFQKGFAEMEKRLNRSAPRWDGDSALVASTRLMQNKSAARMAKFLFTMYRQLLIEETRAETMRDASIQRE